MTDSPEKPAHPSLDALLQSWPERAQSDERWEELAENIEERIARGDVGPSLKDVTDAKILAPPLPWIAEEGRESPPSETETERRETPMGIEERRERRSFQDIAKLAGPPPSSAGSASRVRRMEIAKNPGDASRGRLGCSSI